jgi:hypothetical protein
MTTGTKIIYTERLLDAHRKSPRTWKGTVIRVDQPEDGWNEGIVVDYPGIKYFGQHVAIFHEMPHACVREA